MGVDDSDELLDLPGVPDGLAASRVREYRSAENGSPVERTHRRGLRKITRVELVPAGDILRVEMDDSEERWVLDAARRRWNTVQSRYRDRAMARAVELVRAGVVRLICPVDDRMHVGDPTAWVLTEEWDRRADEATSRRQHAREQWSELAVTAADNVQRVSPPLAMALRAASSASPTTPVLVYAAEDLVRGVVHDGPRAFSQAHFADTKARDDVADILRRAGVGDEVLVALGVRRSSRLGVSGPVDCEIAGQVVELHLLDGPVLLRADQHDIVLRMGRASLVVVENLQAAEVLADQLPGIAVLYSAGPPADAALALIASLGLQASEQLIVPDADLGGVRIAERLLSALPNARVIDIGDHDHPVGVSWPADGLSVTGLRAAADGPVGQFAVACLARGYPVEQELATVSAVRAALTSRAPES